MIVQSLENEIGFPKTEQFTKRILSRIAQYRDRCRLIFTLANTDEAVPLARFAVTHRLKRAERLLRHYVASNLRPFETVILMEGETTRLVLPPVVEAIDNGVYIMDGVHRFLAARAFGLTNIYCVRVEGDGLPPLPSLPGSWDDLRVQDHKEPTENNLPGLDQTLFRPLTKLFNSNEFVFRSREEAFCFIDG